MNSEPLRHPSVSEKSPSNLSFETHLLDTGNISKNVGQVHIHLSRPICCHLGGVREDSRRCDGDEYPRPVRMVCIGGIQLLLRDSTIQYHRREGILRCSHGHPGHSVSGRLDRGIHPGLQRHVQYPGHHHGSPDGPGGLHASTPILSQVHREFFLLESFLLHSASQSNHDNSI